MKKLTATIIILIIGTSAIVYPTSVFGMAITSNEGKIALSTDEWIGTVRIEGESNTIWKGTVSFSSSEIIAENMDTHEMETHEISYPCIIGALDEASKQGGFSYTVIYYPSWDSLYVTTIGDDSAGEKTGWCYWVDYEMPMVGADAYELTGDDNEILWGYLYFENWETSAHALQITIDKNTVRKNEEFTVTVYDEAMSPVEDAVVYIDSMTFTTDENGKATISMDTVGAYEVYAEKDPTADNTYLRSDKEHLQVKKCRCRLIDIIERFPMLERLLQILIFNKIISSC